MSYDFGGCDRELAVLGEGLNPDLPALVAAHAPASVSDFTAVDAALDALGEVPEDLRARVAVAAPSAAPPAESPRDPESGEFSLGQPVEQGHWPDGPDASGELPLSSGERSGSYQLPDMDDDGAATDPSSAMEEALHTQHPDAPDAPDTEQVDLSQQPDVQDTVEEPLDPPPSEDAPAPASASQQVVPEESGPEVTQVVPTEPKTAIEASEEEIARADAADDEFDALFDELTSPSNAPPPPAEEQGLCADDELDSSATTPPNVEEDLARLSQQDVPAVHDDDDDEATEIFDAASFAEVLETAQAVQGAPAPIADEDVEELDVEELDADELELMLEEDDGQDDDATTLPPDKKQRQAATADDDAAEGASDANDSPSGLLRRLWGRKSKK